MECADSLKNMTAESLTAKEKEMLDIFGGLDNNGKIAAIHSFYSFACSELIDPEKEEPEAVV